MYMCMCIRVRVYCLLEYTLVQFLNSFYLEIFILTRTFQNYVHLVPTYIADLELTFIKYTWNGVYTEIQRYATHTYVISQRTRKEHILSVLIIVIRSD